MTRTNEASLKVATRRSIRNAHKTFLSLQVLGLGQLIVIDLTS